MTIPQLQKQWFRNFRFRDQKMVVVLNFFEDRKKSMYEFNEVLHSNRRGISRTFNFQQHNFR